MRQLRKATAAAIAGFGVLTLLAAPSFAAPAFAAGDHSATKTEVPVQLAHMGQKQGGQNSGQPCPMGMNGSGMMAPGAGTQGMMTPGAGSQGMMGSGMMGSGMMTPGAGPQGMMGPGFDNGPGLGEQVVPSKDLTADDVRHFLEHRLEMHGNKRLKVGEVKAADEDKITADITTVDGSLVQRLEVDRHSGRMNHIE
ncbi:MAG: hypothetical protein RH942_12215 [Kiloniellaceae bacterium]